MRRSRLFILAVALATPAAAAPAEGARFQRLQAGRLVPAALRDDTRYIAYYHGASWCGPCRLFAPRLIAATPALAARRVEVVFVSDDGTCRAAIDYARRSRMPWLLIPCNDRARRARLRAMGGAALPGLVLATRDGRRVLTSWRVDGTSAPAAALKTILARVEG